ncbi:MAG: DPP IV N-terminal domain-containing protein, partial [Chloroflexota bacterium]|nr:DPP IV N-terminal domain-containing protein [Chloroflexota bacterium]
MGKKRGKASAGTDESGPHLLVPQTEPAPTDELPEADGDDHRPFPAPTTLPGSAAGADRVAHQRSGRPITAEDLFRLKVVGEPVLSPDGGTVAATVTVIDAGADAYRSAIWIVPTEGGTPSQLTAGTKRDTFPRWSPDGTRLAFLSDRDTETPQLWVIPVSGGEARRVTDLENAVSDPVWAPEGRRVAFVSKLTPPDPNPGSDVKVITEVRYKFDGEGFLGGKHRHIWIVDVDREGAKPERVTDGDFEHSSPAWSPSGREVAF